MDGELLVLQDAVPVLALLFMRVAVGIHKGFAWLVLECQLVHPRALRNELLVNPASETRPLLACYPGFRIGLVPLDDIAELDQPLLGIDASNVYVSTNEFSILGPEFNGAQIYAIAKKDLVSLSSNVHFVHFDNLSIGGAVATSIQPALTNGNPAAEYFLNSLDPNGTFDQRIGVWAMTNRGVVATGGKPTLSSLVLGSEAYGIPPASDQKGSSSQIDSGDDRMQQTQSIGGEVYGELTTSVTIPTIRPPGPAPPGSTSTRRSAAGCYRRRRCAGRATSRWRVTTSSIRPCRSAPPATRRW